MPLLNHTFNLKKITLSSTDDSERLSCFQLQTLYNVIGVFFFYYLVSANITFTSSYSFNGFKMVFVRQPGDFTNRMTWVSVLLDDVYLRNDIKPIHPNIFSRYAW